MTQTKQIICTVCPIGCSITVTGEEGKALECTGYSCPRGERYARSEYEAPVRLLTTVVKTKGHPDTPLLAARTDAAVPKELLFQCMELVKNLEVSAPVHQGDVLLENIAGTGRNLIASADYL